MILGSARVEAAQARAKTPLKPFNVTVRVFDPAKGVSTGQDYVLPVDSPDAGACGLVDEGERRRVYEEDRGTENTFGGFHLCKSRVALRSVV